jgi:CRISPR system Cascade subunit CasC
LAEAAADSEKSGTAVDKKAAKTAATRDSSIDIVMFGRMVASEDKAHSLNVDATVQVAHAISVHSVDNEFDYYTAIDDLATEGNAGAAMIDTTEFNSSTLYRYATVNVDELHKGLGAADATSAAVGAFVRAFVTSMPTGKQNAFANRTLPDAVVVTVRDQQSVNLAGAFEEAIVTDSANGRLKEASDRLVAYSKGIDSAYSQSPVASYVLRVGLQTAALSELGDEVSLDELVERVSALVAERVQGSE